MFISGVGGRVETGGFETDCQDTSADDVKMKTGWVCLGKCAYDFAIHRVELRLMRMLSSYSDSEPCSDAEHV